MQDSDESEKKQQEESTKKICPNCLGKKDIQYAIFLMKQCPLCQGKGTVIKKELNNQAIVSSTKEPLS